MTEEIKRVIIRDITEFGLYVFSALAFCLMVYSIIKAINKKRILLNYKNITIGMNEVEMLITMGGEPSVSRYPDRTKYEWFINGSASTTYGRDTSYTTFNDRKSVIITCKNEKVVAVEPHNI